MTTIARLKELEQQIIRTHFLRDMPLERPERIDEIGIKAQLKQRRFLTYEFTPMCESFDVSLEDKSSRQIVSGIVGEELGLQPGEPWPLLLNTHRAAYMEELKEIGVSRLEALAAVPTRKTMRTLALLKLYINELGTRTELEQLAFLRFSGEALTGAEFRVLFDRLVSLGLLTKAKSKFLHPHIDYDVLALNGGTSHADRYLPCLETRLNTADDWRNVERVLKRAAVIRRGFYEQFN